MKYLRPLSIALGIACPAGAAIAQSNVLFVEQSGLGNTLTVEQSQAFGSTIGSNDAPATQIGGLNRLSITDAGIANVLPVISQDNLTGGNGLDGNVANIVLGSGTNGAQVNLVQGALNGTLSGNNVAIIDLVQGTAASIEQNGANNQAALTVNGSDSSGIITQTGSSNAGALTITGVDTVATLTQTGTGLNSVDVPAGTDFTNGAPVGISVIANGTVVNIVQSN